MNGPEFQFACLSDQRLAAYALSPTPVWLWSADATRVLWANPIAAAIFDAASPGALAAVRFAPEHTAAAQIVRLAGTLPQGAAPRLERLRGFGASYGSTMVCLCSRITLADNSPAVLVVSTERGGKDLSLPDRAQRLLTDLERPAAIFSADGELIEAMPAARERFGNHRDLVALGAEQLAREASLNGRADGDIAAWPATMLRLGAGATVTLLVAFATSEKAARAAAPVAQAAPTIPNPAAPELRPHRFPLRFVWQMDAANRFTLGTEEFATILGPKTAALLGRPWAEIADALKLDPQGAVSKALAARATWSGIIVHWPVEDEDQSLPVEMSGLPVFDRDREFTGYRGFGICRDVDRLAALEQRRAQAAAAPREVKAETPPSNVLAFPQPTEETPALSPGERSAFEELARELSARLKSTAGKNAAAPVPDSFVRAPRRANAAARAQRRCRPRSP